MVIFLIFFLCSVYCNCVPCLQKKKCKPLKTASPTPSLFGYKDLNNILLKPRCSQPDAARHSCAVGFPWRLVFVPAPGLESCSCRSVSFGRSARCFLDGHSPLNGSDPGAPPAPPISRLQCHLFPGLWPRPSCIG